ncbi:hypothetical protein [Streptomyces lavendulocolor]|uniref:hypothetical protein n=1 Tax=Streptomyces lavendulocolor TaxID=67316 RepID=UPI003C2C657F
MVETTELVEEPTVPVEPEFPPTPEGEFDEAAAAKGWVVADLYAGSPAAFVHDICESMPDSAKDSSTRPQWLVESGQMDGHGAAILQAGMPKFCPEWTSAVKQAVSGRYDRWFGSGSYEVSSKPAHEISAAAVREGTFDFDEETGFSTIPPGTYRSAGKMENCYWERTTKSGEIVDNNFATSAREITVTIRASDGQFTSENCAVWKPVG